MLSSMIDIFFYHNYSVSSAVQTLRIIFPKLVTLHLATYKKCFHDTFALYRDMDSSGKPPHVSPKVFLEIHSRRFSHQFARAVFRFRYFGLSPFQTPWKSSCWLKESLFRKIALVFFIATSWALWTKTPAALWFQPPLHPPMQRYPRKTCH